VALLQALLQALAAFSPIEVVQVALKGAAAQKLLETVSFAKPSAC
jgi:hypothetical protein